jgi:integrase
MEQEHGRIEQVYGPYPDRGKFRITARYGSGRQAARRNFIFSSEQKALEHARRLKEAISDLTVELVKEDFLTYLRTVKETKSGTLVTHEYRLMGFFGPVLGLPVKDLDGPKAAALYRSYQKGRAPDTHQGALALAKSMFEWARRQKHVHVNPFLDIEPVGKKRHRKPQLRLDETRVLSSWLVDRALTDDRALGVLIALLLGLRAHEVVGIERRDLDDGGRVLHVSKSKTAAGERAVILPAVLRAPLARRAELRSGRLLPYKPGWVRDNTKRACRAAGVPEVCAQSLRGMNATIALEAGTAPEVVARSLGHTNVAITRSSYAQAGSGESVRIGQVVDRLVREEPASGFPQPVVPFTVEQNP